MRCAERDRSSETACSNRRGWGPETRREGASSEAGSLEAFHSDKSKKTPLHAPMFRLGGRVSNKRQDWSSTLHSGRGDREAADLPALNLPLN